VVFCTIAEENGSNYPDLEPDKEFWNQVWVPGSDYKSLVVYLSFRSSVTELVSMVI